LNEIFFPDPISSSSSSRNTVRRCGKDSTGSEQVQVVGSFEHGNESFGSIKGGFLK
jgi:hypothetical protein